MRSIPRSERAGEHIRALAARYPRTKFVSIVGDKCIPDLPDARVPMLVVYRAGEIRQQAVAWGADRERRVEGASCPLGRLQRTRADDGEQKWRRCSSCAAPSTCRKPAIPPRTAEETTRMRTLTTLRQGAGPPHAPKAGRARIYDSRRMRTIPTRTSTCSFRGASMACLRAEFSTCRGLRETVRRGDSEADRANRDS
jgi:hypothetical protein